MDVQSSLDNIACMSFNTTGWSDFKGNLINTILLSHAIQICAIQEHFQLESNLYRLNQAFKDFEVFALPAVKSNHQVHSGRPSGGVALLFDKKLCPLIKQLTCPNSTRVQGIKLNLQQSSYLFINCYFPVDQRNDNNDGLLRTLQDIKYCMDQCDEACNVCILGDLNFEVNRNTAFANLVKAFLLDNNLVTVWSKFDCDFTQCQTRTVHGTERSYFSTLDHFCVKPNFLESCVEATPLHIVDNTSNHEPIFLKFKCTPSKVNNISHKNTQDPKPMCRRASQEDIIDYKYDLQQKLSEIIVGDCLGCTNNHCVDANHREDIDMYAFDIMDSISVCVENNIPFSRPVTKPPVPGWSSYVTPFRDDAAFWFSVWKSAGKPENCVLHDIMKRTRNKYHYSIRKVRKHESLIRKENFMDDCASGKINNILKNIKSSRKINNTQPTSTVDGVTGRENISNQFKNVYQKIYNTHNSHNKVLELLQSTNNKISDLDLPYIEKITEPLVFQVISKLQSGKSDVEFNWGSDALLHGGQILAFHFKNLFRACLIHGHIPEMFSYCSLLPLVKNTKKSKNTSENYRLIAISSLFLKLLDYVILLVCNDSFLSSHMQFGFEKGLSTTMCSWALSESVNYFTNRGSAMYVCLLDLKKAFDLVKHDILFTKLSKKVPPIFLRLIIVSYLCQSCCVKWDNFKSENFTVTNGARQGAVASPVYFNVYLDDLFEEMKQSGFGCYIDSFFYGLLGYADDCALLSPSREGLQHMLNICVKYFSRHGIQISVDEDVNKSKTKCLSFNVSSEPSRLVLKDLTLPWVDSATHLGHTICADAIENTSKFILSSRAKFVSKTHELQQELGDQHPQVFIRLVQTYLSSFYGSNLFNLFSETAEKLYISWNIFIRGRFGLPFATHRYILYNMCLIPHIRVSLINRFVNFYKKLKFCRKPEIRHLFHIQQADNRSVFGINCLNICRECDKPCVDQVFKHDIRMPIQMTESDEWRIPLLNDLISLRDDLTTDIPKPDIRDMINFICCD